MDLYELENKLKRLRILGAEDHTPVIVVVGDDTPFDIDNASITSEGFKYRKAITLDIVPHI